MILPYGVRLRFEDPSDEDQPAGCSSPARVTVGVWIVIQSKERCVAEESQSRCKGFQVGTLCLRLEKIHLFFISSKKFVMGKHALA